MNDKSLFLDLVKVALNFQSISIDPRKAVKTLYRANVLAEGCIPPSDPKMASDLRLPSIDVAASEFVEWSALDGGKPDWVEFETEI